MSWICLFIVIFLYKTCYKINYALRKCVVFLSCKASSVCAIFSFSVLQRELFCLGRQFDDCPLSKVCRNCLRAKRRRLREAPSTYIWKVIWTGPARPRRSFTVYIIKTIHIYLLVLGYFVRINRFIWLIQIVICYFFM